MSISPDHQSHLMYRCPLAEASKIMVPYKDIELSSRSYQQAGMRQREETKVASTALYSLRVSL